MVLELEGGGLSGSLVICSTDIPVLKSWNVIRARTGRLHVSLRVRFLCSIFFILFANDTRLNISHFTLIHFAVLFKIFRRMRTRPDCCNWHESLKPLSEWHL